MTTAGTHCKPRPREFLSKHVARAHLAQHIAALSDARILAAVGGDALRGALQQQRARPPQLRRALVAAGQRGRGQARGRGG